MKFIDEATIEVASGRGGRGCVSFRKEAYIPKGGPDGGDGGRGGHIIFKTNKNMFSLLDFQYQKKHKAPDGASGKKQKCHGKNGKDLIIQIPSGTLIKSKERIVDLSENNHFVFLKGGQGGKGNCFYKTSSYQAPYIAQKGLPGQQAKITLELKLLAQVGIIGLPNVGKSTLISHMSSAKPKIANYPFTTLKPHLGVVFYDKKTHLTLADVPGLIKGASQNLGLGHKFLKHIERTKVLLHLIDANPFSTNNPLQDYYDINKELRLYDKMKRSNSFFKPLTDRPQIVALNKTDLLSEKQIEEKIKLFQKKGIKVIAISAVNGFNLKQLKKNLGDMIFEK